MFVYGEVPAMQEEAHRGLECVMAVKRLAQLQDSETQWWQAHQD